MSTIVIDAIIISVKPMFPISKYRRTNTNGIAPSKPIQALKSNLFILAKFTPFLSTPKR